MTGSHSDPAWVALASGCFDWRLWGDEAVVYVLATGATLELSPSAAAVLAVLLESPGSAQSEQALLTELAGDDVGPQQLQQLRELLGHMRTMGLIEHREPALLS